MFLKLSFTELNWISHLIALAGVLLLCWPTFWYSKLARKFATHRKIDPASVRAVRVFDSGTAWELTPAEIRQLVEWFNEAAFIQKREYEIPRAGQEGVAIELSSGEEILIVSRDGDFDVVRRRPGNPDVTYWARHPELGHFLAERSAKLPLRTYSEPIRG
ncbi:hypothetical protein [Effusibacillus pohliae]|uniref:hypothetical protein n=1 Tax=Effusibacillus pohliae TaxID=232270 RepID=UPI00037EFE60|nr:hypothetical protein [Effusibacillus pohliae]